MNVFDFDYTIYRKDSSIRFFLFCLQRHPLLLRYIPIQLYSVIIYVLKLRDKTWFKSHFFIFIRGLKDLEYEVRQFWDIEKNNICDWYLELHSDNDVVISASPEFLLQPICSDLHVKKLIASKVNPKTGVFEEKNNRGSEKVKNFYKIFGYNSIIENFYSDSDSDLPLAMIAINSYKVINGKITNWNNGN